MAFNSFFSKSYSVYHKGDISFESRRRRLRKKRREWRARQQVVKSRLPYHPSLHEWISERRKRTWEGESYLFCYSRVFFLVFHSPASMENETFAIVPTSDANVSFVAGNKSFFRSGLCVLWFRPNSDEWWCVEMTSGRGEIVISRFRGRWIFILMMTIAQLAQTRPERKVSRRTQSPYDATHDI